MSESPPLPVELEERLLHSSRNGDLPELLNLLQARSNGQIELDVSCKGKSKSNLGWSPLHLAAYFGHQEAVELLLDHGAQINAVNDIGDTPLHKAAYIGREDLVLLLIERNADVNVRNGEGLTALQVCRDDEAAKLLDAAARTEVRRREDRLLAAARDGHINILSQMLKDERPPNINCVDGQGNTCLHCAAYRGHKEAAVLLLQNGIDTTIRNIRGQTALELANDAQMQQVLGVKPVRQLQKTATRFDGQLLRRSRFLGWKPVWAVLERGVLSYFNSRADAMAGVKRKDFKYVDGARGLASALAPSAFTIIFSDGQAHKLSVPISGEDTTGELSRMKWMGALNEHVAYSSHYLNQGTVRPDSDDEEADVKPLGSMQDALQNAAARYQLVDAGLREIRSSLDQTDTESAPLAQVLTKFEPVTDAASSMLTSLSHCLTLITQQEEVRELRLRQERDKCRVLEEALTMLAREHHQLEQSIASHVSSPTQPLSRHTSANSLRVRSPRYYETSEDEFYDAFEADSDTENDADTLVTAGGPGSDSDTLVSFPSPTSSVATLVSVHSFRSARECPAHKPHRIAARRSLPQPMFSRNDFSLWSVLKTSIGKELSNVPMPVVFNEPLSFLERMVEYMEYAHLLRYAAEQSDPLARMQYVAAFAVSALSSNWDRLGKPFNPLLGETYELERPEFRVVCEQVSHHPPVSAFHADSEHFIFHGSTHPKLKFWGKSVEISPKGVVTVELPKWGEAYTWTNVNCCVHNVIVGKLWIEQYGTMEIVNHSTGHRAELTFKPAGWFSKDLHRVEGFIMDKQKRKYYFMYGKWTEFIKVTDFASYEVYAKENAEKFRSDGKAPNLSDSPAHTPKKVLAKLNSFKMGTFKSMSMSVAEPDEGCEDGGAEGGDIPKCDSTYSIDIPNSTTLWECEPRPENSAQFYQFTYFAMSLNEIEPGMERKLCPTDCRLRPDVRKLEQGDLDGASTEKTRLEEKQRDIRKARKHKKGQEWVPRWFCQGANPYTGHDDWLYAGGYWDRNYTSSPNIF